MTIYLPSKIRAKAQPPTESDRERRLDARECRITERERELNERETRLRQQIRAVEADADQAAGRRNPVLSSSDAVAAFVIRCGKLRRAEITDDPLMDTEPRTQSDKVAQGIVASAMVRDGTLDPDAPPRTERERLALAALRLLR